MAEIPRPKALKLLARLAGIQVCQHKGRVFIDAEVGASEWNPYTNAHQLNGLIEQEKVSVVWHPDDKEWCAYTEEPAVFVFNDGRTEAAIQCLAQIAKERFGE